MTPRRIFLKYGTAAALAAPLLLLPRRSRASTNPDVTVLVAEEDGPIRLEGDPLVLGGDSFGGDPVTIRAKKGDILAGGKSLDSPLEVGPGVSLNGKRYTGSLVLKAKGNTIRLLETLPLESYLPGVVMAETYESWEPAAHEAQAISARSYALMRLHRGRAKGADFDFFADTRDKAYGGACDNGQILGAVKATTGERLTYKDSIAETVFHSCCGGQTEAAEVVWGREVAYLKSVTCDFCKDSPEYIWKCQIEPEVLLKKLEPEGLTGEKLVALKVSKKSRSKRATEFEAETDTGVQTVDAQKFRTAVGGTVIRSLRVRADVIEGMADFIGSGYGHGVGLCQWGAQGMALEGRDRKSILALYYPGTRIERD